MLILISVPFCLVQRISSEGAFLFFFVYRLDSKILKSLGSQSSNTMHQLLLEPRASSVVVSGSSGGFFFLP